MNIKTLLYLIVFTVFTPAHAYKHNLAVCAIFQNEGRFLKEWLEFNILIGVEHFYLYNNYSTDNYLEILQPYIDAGIVDCIDWPYSQQGVNEKGIMVMANQILAKQHCGNSIQGRVRGRAQVLAYNHCLDNIRGKVKWLMLIDIDEFLFPVKCDNLNEFLKDYEEFAAIGVPWIMFGTSDIDRIPDNKLLIESLIMREAITKHTKTHVKSIVQPNKIKTFDVHIAKEFYSNYFQATPNKVQFHGIALPPFENTDKVRINHYWTRDKQFLYEYKIPRQYFFNKKLSKEWVLKLAALINQQEDLTIQKYVNQLKEKVFKK